MEFAKVWRENNVASELAVQRASAVLERQDTTDLLKTYYREVSNYAGSTFLDLEPNDPYEILPSDLLAVTTLSVPVHPAAIRRFRTDSLALGDLLRTLEPGWKLETVDPSVAAVPMAAFYEAVKTALRRAGADRGNSWVTASKICARKRPHLYPVRDNVVLRYLGLPMNYPEDWPAFRALMTNDDLMRSLRTRIEEAMADVGVRTGGREFRMRHLDVALWMHARTGSGRSS